MSDPRKHHFLPQFYLRGFSTDGRGLHQVEKPSGRHYGARVKDLAAIRDFHELDHGDALDPNALERNLAKLEEVQATCLAEVLCEGIRDKAARVALIRLLAIMRMRVPAIKDHVEGSLESVVRATALQLERQGKLPPPPKGHGEALRVKNLQFQISNWKCLEKMFGMGENERILKNLFAMRATLVRAPFGDAFLTSDQPVAIYHPSRSVASQGVGPETPGAEVSFPLSSRALLLLDHRHSQHGQHVASSDEVAEFNRRTVVMAKNYVLTGEDPTRAAELVLRNVERFAGFVYDNLDAGRKFVQVHRFIAVGPA